MRNFKKSIVMLSTLFFLTSCTDSPDETHSFYSTVSYLSSYLLRSTERSGAFNTEELIEKSDKYLFLLYMDGDNNLNDYIYKNVLDLSWGVYNTLNSDGSPKNGYKKVKTIVLWDGVNGSYSYNYKNTMLLEMVNKGTPSTAPQSFSNNLLDCTQDSEGYVVYINDWYTSLKSTREAAMCSGKNLMGFIDWAKHTYPGYDHIILQFGDHGSGASYGISDARTMCSDSNTGFGYEGSSLLFTNEVKDALSLSLDSTKLDMIILDVCYGCTIEEAYEYKDYTKSIVASPNTIPGRGYNYTNLMEGFHNNMTIESFGIYLVDDYADRFVRASNGTLSFLNICEIDNVKNSLSSLCEKIIEVDDLNLKSYLKNELLQYGTSASECSYKSVYSYVFDLGNTALKLKSYIEKNNLGDEPAYGELANDVNKLIDALDCFIVTSWKYYDNRIYGYYRSLFSGTQNYFGISIAAGSRYSSTPELNKLDFYSNNNWYNLLKYLQISY